MVALTSSADFFSENALSARRENYRHRSGASACSKPSTSNRLRRANYDESDRLESCSKDPIGHGGGPHLYAFVSARTPTLVDPLGMQQCFITSTGKGGSDEFNPLHDEERGKVYQPLGGFQSFALDSWAQFGMEECPELSINVGAFGRHIETQVAWLDMPPVWNILNRTAAKARVVAKCEFEPRTGKCQVQLSFDPPEDRQTSVGGIYIRSTMVSEAKITAEDYNDEGSCVTLTGIARAEYTAGYAVETPYGNPTRQWSELVSSQITSRVCCHCGECPDKRSPTKIPETPRKFAP